MARRRLRPSGSRIRRTRAAGTTIDSARDSSGPLGCGPTTRVLDVACGRGAVLVPAARAVGQRWPGARGRLVARDGSARRRAGRGGRARRRRRSHGRRTARPPGRLVRRGAVRVRPLLPAAPRARCRAGSGVVLAPGGTVALSTWGAEDPRWAWEDELLADVAVERRARTATVRPARRARSAPRRAPASTTCASRRASSRSGSLMPTSGGRGSGRTASAGSSSSYRRNGWSGCVPTARARLDRLGRGHGLPLKLEALFAIGHAITARLLVWRARPTCAGSHSRCPRPPRRTDRFAFSVAQQGQAEGVRLDLDGARRAEEAARARTTRSWRSASRTATRRRRSSRADTKKFFTEPHYNGFPAVLVRLAAIEVDELEELIIDALALSGTSRGGEAVRRGG